MEDSIFRWGAVEFPTLRAGSLPTAPARCSRDGQQSKQVTESTGLKIRWHDCDQGHQLRCWYLSEGWAGTGGLRYSGGDNSGQKPHLSSTLRYRQPLHPESVMRKGSSASRGGWAGGEGGRGGERKGARGGEPGGGKERAGKDSKQGRNPERKRQPQQRPWISNQLSLNTGQLHQKTKF